MKIDFISDINKGYESALNYFSVDRFVLKVLYWNLGIFMVLNVLNSVFRLANYFPSPFSWRVIGLSEACYAAIIAIWATAIPALLIHKISNHYIYRILITICLVVYSYLFVFISGGSIEMHFHFFMIAALLVVYADWRLGWILLLFTGLHHGILNYFQPGWVYFYGRNDFSVISHSLPVLGIVIFTTVLSNNSRNLIGNLEIAKISLQDQKKWLEVLLDKLPVGVSVAEAPSGKLTMINKNAVSILGRGVDPSAKKEDYGRLYDVIKQDGTPYPVDEMAPVIAMKTGIQSTKDDVVVKKSDGTKVLLRATSVPVKNEEGESTAIVSILEDITTEKEERKIIEEENAKSEATIESIAEGLIATDEKARIVRVNKKAEEMMGFGKNELLGRWIVGAFAVYDEKGIPLNPHEHPITQALRKRKLVMTNLQFAKKDFSKFIAGVAVSPILIENKPIGAIVIFRDVTKEKEIDRMKTEFISLASHQLRTPLSAMKWNLEELLGDHLGKLSTEQKEFLTDINSSNERMIGLVNSLLNVSRIESGRIIVDPMPTSLKKLMKDVHDDLKAKIEEKNQIFEINIDENLEEVNLDPKLIRQVYMNLLTNSIKYTPEKGKVTVAVYKKGKDLISQISDNGYGIPKKDHQKVFQKFYRGENVAKTTDGNGLGMYLVKAIIESSNGKIWFESREGKGTTFWFSLPLSGMKSKKGEVFLSA